MLWWFFPSKKDSYWIPNMKDVTFEGGHRTLNAKGARNLPAPFTGLFGPNQEHFLVDGVEFVDYGDVSTISQCFDCCGYRARQGAHTTRFNNLRFHGCDRRTSFACPAKQIFYDLDGSLSGSMPHSTVTAYHAFNEWEECPRAGKLFSDGLVCNSSVRVRKMGIPLEVGVPLKVAPFELANRDLVIKKSRLVNPYGFTVILQTAPNSRYLGSVPHFMKKLIMQAISDLVGLTERHVKEVDVPAAYLLNGSASTVTPEASTTNPTAVNTTDDAGTICGATSEADKGPRKNMAVVIGGFLNTTAKDTEYLYKAYNLMCKGKNYTDPELRNIDLYWQKLKKFIRPGVDIRCTEPEELVNTCEEGWNMNSPHVKPVEAFHSQTIAFEPSYSFVRYGHCGNPSGSPAIPLSLQPPNPNLCFDYCREISDCEYFTVGSSTCYYYSGVKASPACPTGIGFGFSSSSAFKTYQMVRMEGTACDSTDGVMNEIDRFYAEGVQVCKTRYPGSTKVTEEFCKAQNNPMLRRRRDDAGSDDAGSAISEDTTDAASTPFDMYACSRHYQSQQSTLLPVVNKGASGCTSSKQCAACQGDCDEDSHCASGLKCVQRTSSSQTVPGCAATGYVATTSDHDHCYNPDQSQQSTGGSSDTPCKEYYGSVKNKDGCRDNCLAKANCTSFTYRSQPGSAAACIMYDNAADSVIGTTVVPGSMRTQGQNNKKDAKLTCKTASELTGGTTCEPVPIDSTCWIEGDANSRAAAAQPNPLPTSTNTCQAPTPMMDEFGGVNFAQFGATGELFDNKDGHDILQFGPGKHQDDSFDWFGWTIPLVTHHSYLVDFQMHDDWEQMSMQYAVPELLQNQIAKPKGVVPPEARFNGPEDTKPLVDTRESVLLSWPYNHYRYRYSVATPRDDDVEWYDIHSDYCDKMNCSVWNVQDDDFHRIGIGNCKTGQYAGGKSEEALTYDTCKMICASEPECRFFSLSLRKSCTRYDTAAGDCSDTFTFDASFQIFKKIVPGECPYANLVYENSTNSSVGDYCRSADGGRVVGRPLPAKCEGGNQWRTPGAHGCGSRRVEPRPGRLLLPEWGR